VAAVVLLLAGVVCCIFGKKKQCKFLLFVIYVIYAIMLFIRSSNLFQLLINFSLLLCLLQPIGSSSRASYHPSIINYLSFF